MMLASSALYKRLERKTRFVRINQDIDKQICDIALFLLE